MIPRPDLLDERSPQGIEVFQLTTEPDVPSCHIYMEAPIFTPDSKRLIVHRSAHPHGSDKDDPEHRYLLCDLKDGASLTPLTEETGITGPAISPDGKFFYYFVNETELNAGRLTLKRVRLDGTGRETLIVLDTKPANAPGKVSHIYPLSTISSDGQRLAISGFFGDGKVESAPWGMLVFDLECGDARLAYCGTEIHNLHPQYCRSHDPELSHDVMIQENHDSIYTPDGTITRSVSYIGEGFGCDVHVVRDDGTNLRDTPFGRDGKQWCQGHQAWRGRTDIIIAAVGVPERREEQLFEGRAIPHAGHRGRGAPGAMQNDLSRNFKTPLFFHFATDIEGKRFITDGNPRGTEQGCDLFLADLGRPMEDPLLNWRYLLDTGTHWAVPDETGIKSKSGHPHPFLSPDGRLAFFNSTESGNLQAYMIRGLENV